jgi:hypothetical protein
MSDAGYIDDEQLEEKKKILHQMDNFIELLFK